MRLVRASTNISRKSTRSRSATTKFALATTCSSFRLSNKRDKLHPTSEFIAAAWRGGGYMTASRGRVEGIGESPHERRHGWLKNGNPPGDLSKAPRCGAKNRRDASCQCPAMRNGRCRLHGGLSTGPKTPEGIERIRRAATKHGMYSAAAITERKRFRDMFKDCREVLFAAKR